MLKYFHEKAQNQNLSHKISAPPPFTLSPSTLSTISSSSFSLILASMVLHHIPNPSEIISLLSSLLLPGGYIVLVDFEKREIEEGDEEREKRGVFHPRGFSEEDFVGMVEGGGRGVVVEGFERFYITKKLFFSCGGREVTKEEEEQEMVILGCIARKKKEGE